MALRKATSVVLAALAIASASATRADDDASARDTVAAVQELLQGAGPGAPRLEETGDGGLRAPMVVGDLRVQIDLRIMATDEDPVLWIAGEAWRSSAAEVPVVAMTWLLEQNLHLARGAFALHRDRSGENGPWRVLYVDKLGTASLDGPELARALRHAGLAVAEAHAALSATPATRALREQDDQ